MRKILILFLMCLMGASAKAQCNFRNTAFKSGEYLSYNLYFNWKFVWIKVGTASMNIVQSHYNGKQAYRSSLITRGNSKADRFFVLRDTLLCYSTLDLAPLYYHKGAHEGDRYYTDEVFYSYPEGRCHVRQHQINHKGESKWQQHTYSECVFDMLNIFLRARSFNPSNWKKGYTVNFSIVDGDSKEDAMLKYNGKKIIKADNGHSYRTLQVSYMEKEDGKYKRIVDFFISDDSNHVPVRLDMFLRFGSAKAYMSGLQGVRSALTSMVK